MPSKESLERAAKFDFECTGSDDHDDTNCRKCAGMRETLANLLDEAVRAVLWECMTKLGEVDNRALFESWLRERLAQLEKR